MHASEPLLVPDLDRGIPVVRWHVEGFYELRRTLLSRKATFELLEGHVVFRPGGSARHDCAVHWLAEWLGRHLGPAHEVVVEDELVFPELHAVVQPDVTVWAEDPERPVLVVEVSDEDERVDPIEKRRLYATAGIPAYWRLDLVWGSFCQDRSPRHGRYGSGASQGVVRGDAPLLGWDLPPLPVPSLVAAAQGAAMRSRVPSSGE